MPDEPTGRLTVHALDTARGMPAASMPLGLYRIEGEARTLLTTRHTNSDGRCDAPLLLGNALRSGVYEIVFDVGAWRSSHDDHAEGFYDLVPIRFRVTEASAHYHIPLLLSPFGYSTYRGS